MIKRLGDFTLREISDICSKQHNVNSKSKYSFDECSKCPFSIVLYDGEGYSSSCLVDDYSAYDEEDRQKCLNTEIEVEDD